jgi:hypothetical protein
MPLRVMAIRLLSLARSCVARRRHSFASPAIIVVWRSSRCPALGCRLLRSRGCSRSRVPPRGGAMLTLLRLPLLSLSLAKELTSFLLGCSLRPSYRAFASSKSKGRCAQPARCRLSLRTGPPHQSLAITESPIRSMDANSASPAVALPLRRSPTSRCLTIAASAV